MAFRATGGNHHNGSNIRSSNNNDRSIRPSNVHPSPPHCLTSILTPSHRTDSSQLAESLNGAVSQYIPQSILPAIGIAIQSAASSASITGDINSIVQSALTADPPPSLLAAIPTQYSRNVASLQGALSNIRGEVSTTTPTPTPTPTSSQATTQIISQGTISDVVVFITTAGSVSYNVTVTESVPPTAVTIIPPGTTGVTTDTDTASVSFLPSLTTLTPSPLLSCGVEKAFITQGDEHCYPLSHLLSSLIHLFPKATIRETIA